MFMLVGEALPGSELTGTNSQGPPDGFSGSREELREGTSLICSSFISFR